MAQQRILIIRFSSFGDVVQCLSLPAKIKELFPESEIHWLTRSDMAPLVETHPLVTKVYGFQRQGGLKTLATLALQLRDLQFTHIYDAHNNTRSNLVLFLMTALCLKKPQVLQRSVKRWKRFLLFSFRKNTFQMPFSGQRDMLEKLLEWGAENVETKTPQFFPHPESISKAQQLTQNLGSFIALAPSAAYPLKRWPEKYWQELILSLPEHKFVLLGGPEDTFLKQLEASAPERVLNLAGACDLMTSSSVVSLSQALVANDTGLMHIGEQLGKPTIALMGPAPFGFPSRQSTVILERDLSCRPCSKHGQGPCRNSEFQKCLMEIKPAEVQSHLRRLLS